MAGRRGQDAARDIHYIIMGVVFSIWCGDVLSQIPADHCCAGCLPEVTGEFYGALNGDVSCWDGRKMSLRKKIHEI